jgi:hypothetical protein
VSSEAVGECAPSVDLSGSAASGGYHEGRIGVEVEALDANRLVMVSAANTIHSPLLIYVICHFFDS